MKPFAARERLSPPASCSRPRSSGIKALQRSEDHGTLLLIAIPLIILLALLAIWFFICTEFRRLAIEKGYRSIRYFHLCFWLGIFGMLIVIGLPDRKARPGYAEEPVPERQPPRQKEPKAKSMEPVTNALHRIGGHLLKTSPPSKPKRQRQSRRRGSAAAGDRMGLTSSSARCAPAGAAPVATSMRPPPCPARAAASPSPGRPSSRAVAPRTPRKRPGPASAATRRTTLPASTACAAIAGAAPAVSSCRAAGAPAKSAAARSPESPPRKSVPSPSA